MLKTKKNNKNLFNILKLILLVGVGIVLYRQISAFDAEAWEQFTLDSPLWFILSILLVVPNIGLAYAKWKLTLKAIHAESDVPVRIQSFFAGVITGMLTPNMIGNFLGRLYYFNRKHRSMIVLFTLFSNYAQFIASLTFGTLAFLLMNDSGVFADWNQIGYLLVIGSVVVLGVYFFIEKITVRFSKKDYFEKFKFHFENAERYKIKLLMLSFARFFVFSIQFNLLLVAFGEDFNTTTILSIWIVYLVTMVAPSLILGKIGIKESISLFILVGVGMNEYAILSASLIIWFVNSLSPALLGLLICRNKEADD